MKTKIAAGLMIGMIAAGCGGKKDKEGLGAGADTTGIRDTVAATPAPAPISDSVRERTSKILGDSTSKSSATATPKNQTQSGMKNKTGQSTLGSGVKRTSPDASQPVMAKGDTLAQSADQRATDSLNRAVLDRLTKQSDSARISGDHDTMPQPSPVPVPPVPTDTNKPAPPDSVKPMPMPMPMPTDSVKPAPTDSTKTPPPLPLDTIRIKRDTTARDTTKHQ